MGAPARREANAVRDLAKELAAAGALKAQLKAILAEGDDEDTTLRDTIEGETGLLETVDAVLAQIGADLARIEGLKKYKSTIEARQKRFENRTDLMRTMLTNTLDVIAQKRLERPLATVTLKDVPPKLNVVSEAEVPAKYWRRPEPELDKKALTDALKQRGDVLDQIEKETSGAAPPDETAKLRHSALLAACPPIPGAELTNGSVTVQIRFG